MITRGKRREALKRAIQRSENGETTYVLLSNCAIVVTQDADEAKTYVHTHGYGLYAKCKDGRVEFSES